MSKRLHKRGLVIADEAKDATARCADCVFVQRWLGVSAESVALEFAKRHAEQTGHRVRVEYARRVEYAPAHIATDHRLSRVSA